MSKSVLSSVGASSAQAPQAEIKNTQLQLKMYLPESERGFYQGVRFDGAGVLFDLEYAGHHIFQPWFTNCEPSLPDFIYKGEGIIAGRNSAMAGPADEFQTPIGYDTARPGDLFLKIGVGLLRKIDNAPYSFMTQFEIVDGGKWSVSQTEQSISFTQEFGAAGQEYGYRYTKTIRLIGESSQMAIEHRLQNTGKRALTSRVYNHNFFTVDGIGVSAGDSLTVPFAIKAAQVPEAALASIKGKTFRYLRDLQREDCVQFAFDGFSGDAKDYDFTITRKKAQLQMRIVGDRPLVAAYLWSIRSVLCAEPFIEVHAEPGKDFSWSYIYTFSIPE